LNSLNDKANLNIELAKKLAKSLESMDNKSLCNTSINGDDECEYQREDQAVKSCNNYVPE